jgi:hypothetical protein
MFTRMILNLSGRFQPWDTSRQFAARGCLSLKSRQPDFLHKCLSPSLSSRSPSASRMKVSGSTSPVARAKRIYPAVSSRFKRRAWCRISVGLLGFNSHTFRPIDTVTNRCTARYAGCRGDECIVVVTVESARSSTSSESARSSTSSEPA